MRYIWEAIDIRVGRRIWSKGRPTNGESIIGYALGEKKRYTLTDLTDGLHVADFDSLDALVKWLNDAECRPATVELPDIQT